MPLDHRVWDFIKSIEEADDVSRVERVLLSFAHKLGFRWVFVGIVPDVMAKPCEIDSHVLLQKFPDGWAERYNSKCYALRDPVVRHLHDATKPFTWEDAYGAHTRPDDVKLIGGEAAEFGLKTGYVIPIRFAGSALAALSFGANLFDADPDMLLELAFAANLGVGHLLRLRYRQNECETVITPRERECILWASEGKTDWEIAVILGISPPTVAKHLLSARQRLDVMNRAHLIGEAVRKKIIR